MSFNLAARTLLKAVEKVQNSTTELDSLLKDLDEAGFSQKEILQEYRTLYDNAEDESTKRMILADITKMRGMLKTEEKREIPQITINVNGDNTRVGLMLNPSLGSGEPLDAHG